MVESTLSWQTVNSHEEQNWSKQALAYSPSPNLLVINSAAFTCNVPPLWETLHCFALQSLLGGAIVICIQSKYAAGGREIS